MDSLFFLQTLNGEIIKQIYIIPDQHGILCLHMCVCVWREKEVKNKAVREIWTISADQHLQEDLL